MLPRVDVEVSWNIQYAEIRGQGDEQIESPGSRTDRPSVPPQVDTSWKQARRWLEREERSLARIAGLARDAEEFDELAREEEDWVVLEVVGAGDAPTDLGVRAVCRALGAAGCVVAASCRGHSGKQAWSECPRILFAAEPGPAKVLESIAKATGCGLASAQDRLQLWAPSLEEMIRFAERLIQARSEFRTSA